MPADAHVEGMPRLLQMTAIAQEELVPQPSGRPWSKQPEPKGAATQIAELKDLVVGYAKQETVDPLKTLGRYLGYGFAGSVVIGLGLSMLLLALLRGLQQIEIFNDGDRFEGGTFSWAPYGITALVGTIVVALFMMRLMSMSRNRGNR
jgi:hypothetical protein